MEQDLKEMNGLPQERQDLPDDSKPLFSNSVQSRILLVIDLVGLVGIIVYCYFIQSYISTFFFFALLLLILLTWQSQVEKVGMYEKNDSTKKIYKSYDNFIQEYQGISENYKNRKTIYETKEQQFDDVSEILDEEQEKYKPLYWLVYRDSRKFIWISILIVSGLSLVMKSTFVGLLSTQPSQTANLMSYQNFEGLEIFFDPETLKIDAKQYVKIFLPNGVVFIFCCLVMIFRRVNNIKFLEEYQEELNQQLFNIYMIFVWVLIAANICTNQSLIGYIFILYQLGFTFRIFCAQNVPNSNDLLLVESLKYFILLIMVFLYLLSCPYFVDLYINDEHAINIELYIGVETIYFLVSENYWKSYIFGISNLLLFTLLCIMKEQINYNRRRKQLGEAVKDCCQHKLDYLERIKQSQLLRESEIVQRLESDDNIQQEIEEKQLAESAPPQDQEISKQTIKSKSSPQIDIESTQQHQEELLKRFNNQVSNIGKKIKLFIDQPIITLRLLQLTCITIVILMKTYYSLLIVFWVIISAFTLNSRINSITSITLAIPGILTNFITFYYQNIPSISLPNSSFQICNSQINENGIDYYCQRFGFFTDPNPFINLLFLDISLGGFILFLKQVTEESQRLIEQRRKQQDKLLKEEKEKNKNEKIGWFNLILAVIVRSSYIVSLGIVFYVGFFDVNVIQFVLVLFLLVFLINDSTQCEYKRQTRKGVETIAVPFAFKYWVLFVIYMSIINLGRYIYLLFYEDNPDSQNQNNSKTTWILQLIGIDKDKYEIVFWVLFYFVALQYDSYKSTFYLKYQNKLFDKFMDQIERKKSIGDTKQLILRLQLLFLKGVIWLSFSINLCFLIFSPFSFINTFLLVFVGFIFVYYTITVTTSVNYKFMSTIWYIYLNILILTFIVRYLFQFICIPNYTDIKNINLINLYDKLMKNYQEFGLYQYDTSRLRLEYFPDMLTIFFGALSLNTYRILNQSQKEQKILLSESELGSALEEDQINQIDKQQRDLVREYAKLMQISILDEWKWLKQPILFLAQINTDVLTLYVVISVVFYIRNIAAFILLILYLSYFLTVHHELLNIMQRNHLLNKLVQQIGAMKAKYIQFDNLQQLDHEDKQIRELVSQIKFTRMRIRIQKKRLIWQISFSFTAFCIFLTYFSQYLSIYDNDPNNKFISDASVSLFVFGTFAQEKNSDSVCFCGPQSSAPQCSATGQQTTSNILNAVLFYMILLFANVLDTGCTMILQEELEKDMMKLKDQEKKEQKPDLSPEFDDKVQKSEDEQKMSEFLSKHPYIKLEIVEQYDHPQLIDKMEIRREAVILNYYFNKAQILRLKIYSALFSIFQRFLVLILLFNTIIVNNIFSLVYLIVTTILFLRPNGITNIKILNIFAVVAIWLQFSLYLLNLTPNVDDLPTKSLLTVDDYSIVDSLGPNLKTYLGFSNGDLMNCTLLTQTAQSRSELIFTYNDCQSNQYLNWVFIINTFVISLIYVYFLIVQFLSNQVILKADEMEKNQEQTIDFLYTAMKNNKIKIKLNFQGWKDKSYTFYQLMSSWILKNNHMIILALVIMLSQTNRVIFNLFELFAGLIFFAITQFYFKFPKTKDQNSFEISYLKWLFYLPVLTVASFTILKLPELLDHCANQNLFLPYNPDPSLIFLCSQIFDIRIAGMVWIMFFISLHFDLEQSQDHHELLDKLQNQTDQKARMISLALAYNKNHKKYKSMLKAQSQKAIFQFIQEKTQEKLKIWHQKLLDQNNKTEQMQEEAIEQALLESKVEEQTEKELVSEAPNTTDFQKQLIGAIKKIQSFNDRFKYMGQVNLMDYILSQNQILQRKITLQIEDFLKRDYTKFNSELEFIQIFYNRAHDQVATLKTFNLNVRELIKYTHLKMLTNRKAGQRKRQGAVGNASMIGSGLIKSDQVDEIPQIKLSANPQMVSFIDFNQSKNLSFIQIQDKSNIIFLENTKYSAQLPELTTFRLVLKLLQEILRLVISNWISFCYLMIILYYAKNSGLLGGFLPFLLFTWVLIDERATAKIFWVLAYVVFSITSIVIFCYSLTGLYYVMQYNNPNLEMGLIWYFPLYDSNYDLVFEIFLIWFIILQIFLSQKNGVYYKSLQEIENIFQGYVRVKLNKFNQYFRQEIVQEERKKNIDPSNQNQKLINQGYQEVLMQDDQQMLGSVKSDQSITTPQQPKYESKITESVRIQEEIINKEKQDEEEKEKLIQPSMKKASNNLEKRILMDTTLITGGDHGLFERVFSYKFTRPGIDLYTITAFIQIIIILYTILFFSSMVNDGVNINNIIKTNQIPGSLIIALLIEIILMVAERYITLKDSVQIFEDEEQNESAKESKKEDPNKKEDKSEQKKKKKKQQSFTQKYKTQFLMKFALQLIMICLIFWFVFIYLGAPWQVQNDTTRRNSEDANIPQIYFKTNGFVKCFFLLYCAYFTVSALQLRVGYQQLKLRNTFLRSYNQVSNVFAKVFYAIPFLFELKVLMDWTFLETSLDVFQWFRLEDITGLMYFTKIQSKGYVNTPLGQKQPKIMKWGFGCTFVLFILLCILGPLILFSSFNPSSQLNLVTGGEFLLSITNVQTGLNVQLYSTNQLQGLENQLNDQEAINKALGQVSTNPIINQAPSTGALQEFQLLSYANNRWAISNPLFESLLGEMNQSISNGSSQFVFNFTYTFTRDQQKIIPQKNQFCYPGNTYLQTYPGQNQTYLNVQQLTQLYNMLTDCTYDGNPLLLPSFYVQTLQLYSPDGTTFKPKPINSNGIDSVMNVSINLQCAENTATFTNLTSSWWSLLYDGVSTPIIQQKSSQGLIFFIVSDKFSPLTYGFSIITIYTSVILLIGSFIRSLFSGQVWLLEYYGMVYPDDLLMICEAISIARSQKDLKRENLLYFELIDILRSPEIVKVMTGSWSQVFKKKEEDQEIQQAKLKQD